MPSTRKAISWKGKKESARLKSQLSGIIRIYHRASHAPEGGLPQLHRWKKCCYVLFSSIKNPPAYAARGVDSSRYLVWLLTPSERWDIAKRRWVCFGILAYFGIVCEYFSLRIHQKMSGDIFWKSKANSSYQFCLNRYQLWCLNRYQFCSPTF